MEPYRGKHNHLLRRLGEKILDTSLLNGFFAKWSYRFGFHGQLRTTRYEVVLSNHKKIPTPLTIAFASDFHAGPTTHPKIFSDLFAELSLHKPDLLLLGGDFVSAKSRYIDELTDHLTHYHPPHSENSPYSAITIYGPTIVI